MNSLTHCTCMYLHPGPAHLAQELAERFPQGQDWVVQLVNSGAEAVDVALTMARLLSTGNCELLALRSCYVEAARDQGVISGKEGALGNMLRINPPLCLQKDDVDAVVKVLDASLGQATTAG